MLFRWLAVTVAAGGRDAIQKLQIKPEAFNLVVTVSSSPSVKREELAVTGQGSWCSSSQ